MRKNLKTFFCRVGDDQINIFKIGNVQTLGIFQSEKMCIFYNLFRFVKNPLKKDNFKSLLRALKKRFSADFCFHTTKMVI